MLTSEMQAHRPFQLVGTWNFDLKRDSRRTPERWVFYLDGTFVEQWWFNREKSDYNATNHFHYGFIGEINWGKWNVAGDELNIEYVDFRLVPKLGITSEERESLKLVDQASRRDPFLSGKRDDHFLVRWEGEHSIELHPIGWRRIDYFVRQPLRKESIQEWQEK